MKSQMGMWSEWQNKVIAALPNFCVHPLYVAQDMAKDRFEVTADYVTKHSRIIVPGKTLGEEYGARVVDTKSQGRVTRMWLDSMCECNFLADHLDLSSLDVLDIGAGYGRLAVALSPFVKSYTCTDAVPISSFICKMFTEIHAKGVRVVSPEDVAGYTGKFNIAINIHSWSESTLESVQEWLGILNRIGVQYLFTVAHDPGYAAWSGGSFRPYIERDFTLVAEAQLGLIHAGMGGFPHSLWKRK